MLIGVAGYKQNGKNTICNIISYHKPGQVVICSLANPIREIGKIFGFTLEEMSVKKEEPNKFWGVSWRKFAQLVGTDMFRKHFKYDCWIRLAEKAYMDNFDKIVLIDDVRFDNEAEFIKRNHGIVIRVTRPSHVPVQSKYKLIRFIKGLFLHASEKPIKKELVDYEVINDGTIDELKEKIVKIFDEIKIKKENEKIINI